MIRTLAIAAVLVGLAVAALGQDFKKGVAAYDRGDYATALGEWRPLAERGYAGAQFNLGLMYDYGQGVPQDYAEAAKWYRLAAEQGQADAQFNLGFMYDRGRGVPQDYSEAVKWHRLAAEQGHVEAQIILGARYVGGRVVPRDYVRAHMWFSLAAARAKVDAARSDAVKGRYYVAAKMTPAGIAKAQKMAREWLAKHPGLAP